jgi:hypothetical protein
MFLTDQVVNWDTNIVEFEKRRSFNGQVLVS